VAALVSMVETIPHPHKPSRTRERPHRQSREPVCPPSTSAVAIGARITRPSAGFQVLRVAPVEPGAGGFPPPGHMGPRRARGAPAPTNPRAREGSPYLEPRVGLLCRSLSCVPQAPKSLGAEPFSDPSGASVEATASSAAGLVDAPLISGFSRFFNGLAVSAPSG
jgi:hypothetical protein